MHPITYSVAIYARTSFTSQLKTIKSQFGKMESYAADNHWSVSKVFEEVFPDPKDERPILKECLEWCIDEHIGVLLVSELAQLGRSVKEIREIIRRLNEAGVTVHIMDLNLRLWKPDPMLFKAMEVGASLERRRMAVERKAGGQERNLEELAFKYSEELNALAEGLSVEMVSELSGKARSTISRLRDTYFKDESGHIYNSAFSEDKEMLDEIDAYLTEHPDIKKRMTKFTREKEN